MPFITNEKFGNEKDDHSCDVSTVCAYKAIGEICFLHIVNATQPQKIQLEKHSVTFVSFGTVLNYANR